MTIVKTQDLIGPALDWVIAKCEGVEFNHIERSRSGGIWLWLDMDENDKYVLYRPSTDWAQGGPIIEKLIGQGFTHEKADFDMGIKFWRVVGGDVQRAGGPTTLIAAMRCFVASKLGDEVDVPEELI